MNDGLRKALAQEFHDWQKLGQGEIVWNAPVIPEPYFYPFFRHGALVERASPIDDGKRETLLSRMTDKLMGAFKPSAAPLPTPHTWGFLDPLKTQEAPGHLLDERAELFQASWLLTPDIKWNPKQWEALLLSLSRATFPVCLEILATGGEIHFRWIVEENDREVLEDSMHASELNIQPQADLLIDWLESHHGGYFWNRELALEKEFLFPIRSDFLNDPYEGILAAISRLGRDSLSVIQVVFSPCQNSWAESIWRSVITEKGQPFFSGGQSFLKAVQSKCSHPLFAATIRLAVLSEGDGEAVASRLSRSFKCFDKANGFVFADTISQDNDDALRDLGLRQCRRSGVILNAAELFALVHPPSGRVGASALQRTMVSTRRVPQSHALESGLLLGLNAHAGKTQECRLNPSERSRHMHVLGASGTGKSTFLLNLMLQDLEAGNGFAVLDPHGDLVEAVLDRLPEHRIKDVVIFDPADADHPVGFNILRAHSDIEKNLLASDFVAIFERLSSSWGDQMTAVLGNAAMAFLESSQGGTLMDLKRFLIEKGFRDRFLQTVNDPEIRYFWTHEFPLLRGTTLASLLTRLNGFLRHRLIRNMVSQRGEKFDVSRMMDEGKIILAPLSQGLIGQENSWLLGSLMVSRFYQAALSRQAVSENDRRPFFLYLDEAHHFITPSIASLLSGGRKYGLGMILAHQSLDQFPSRESGILGSILSNCHTRVCFRLGDQDAAKIECGFEHFENSDFRKLKIGEAICRIGGSDEDFNISIGSASPLSAEAEYRRNKAVDHSRNVYSLPRDLVEGHATSLRLTALPDAPSQKYFEPHPHRKKELSKLFPAASPEKESRADLPLPISIASDNVAGKSQTQKSPSTPGRGGSRHKAIQQLIKQHGNGLGLRATIESALDDNSGAVDVLLEGQSLKIAFEVADSSPLSQEVKNISKALANGIETVVVVSDDPEHLKSIKAEAISRGVPLSDSIFFLQTEEIGNHFCELGARLASYETTSRGYKVKVRHSPSSAPEQEKRLSAIHRTIAQRLKINKGDSKLH